MDLANFQLFGLFMKDGELETYSNLKSIGFYLENSMSQAQMKRNSSLNLIGKEANSMTKWFDLLYTKTY